MAIILDTSFLIAFHNSRDINHKAATAMKQKLIDKEFGQVYVSDYIFDELTTFLMARSFPQESIRQIGDSLISGAEIQLLRVDEAVFLQSWSLFKKLMGLSFTDCTTIALSKEFKIKKIASFDKGFDRISELKRVP